MPALDTAKLLPVTQSPIPESPPGSGHHVTTCEDGYRVEFTHKDGVHHGVYTKFYPNGQKYIECRYVDGLRQGKVTTWYASGRPKTDGAYRNSLLDGVFTIREDADTWGKTEVEFRMGVPHHQTVWNALGNRISETSYTRDGEPTGIHRLWNWDGTLSRQYEFLDDGSYVLRVHMDSAGRNTVIPEGEVTVWKACKVPGEDQWVTVRLTVPADAQRVTPHETRSQHKSRVSRAKVEEIVGTDGTQYKEAVSGVHRDRSIIYRVGETVVCDRFEADPTVECGAGINVHAHRDHCAQWFPETA